MGLPRPGYRDGGQEDRQSDDSAIQNVSIIRASCRSYGNRWPAKLYGNEKRTENCTAHKELNRVEQVGVKVGIVRSRIESVAMKHPLQPGLKPGAIVSLPVRDIRKSSAWYQETFGVGIVRTLDGHARLLTLQDPDGNTPMLQEVL